MYGLHPIIDLNFIDFSLGAMDEIINQAAKIRFMFGQPVPLVIRATSGTALGGAHHCNSLESLFAHTAGLAVAVPSNAWDVKGLIKTALRTPDPVIFLMHKKLSGVRGEIGDENTLIPFGKARTVKEGKHAAIITYGYTVVTAQKAAATLASEGIDVEIIDLRTLYPLDTDAINSAVQRFGRVVIADEAPMFGSITAEIAATATEANFGSLKGPIVRIGSVRAPISANPGMSEAAIPSVDAMIAAVKKVVAY
jgi:pyruvate dehydrogenase E1 component beta subunit